MRMKWITIVLAGLLLFPFPPFYSEAADPPETLSDTLMVYYFHGKQRCRTCRLLESYAKETLDHIFPAEMAAGKITWLPLNISVPENRHFAEEYNLVSQSLVLVRVKDGKRTDWKNLDKIWLKVRDQEAYAAYVTDSIRQFMREN